EKVYSGTDGGSFRTIYSMPWREEKNSPYRWLWVGDDTGALRFTLFNSQSFLDLGKSQSGFVLSKFDVDPSAEKMQGLSPAVNSIWFRDEMTGYLLRGNRLYRTDNAGFQWRQIYQA